MTDRDEVAAEANQSMLRRRDRPLIDNVLAAADATKAVAIKTLGAVQTCDDELRQFIDDLGNAIGKLREGVGNDD